MSWPARVATLVIFMTTLTLVSLKPRRTSEAIWTVVSAAVLLGLGLVSSRDVVEVVVGSAVSGRSASDFPAAFFSSRTIAPLDTMVRVMRAS